MYALTVSGIVFACTIAAFVFGMFLRNRLPSHHLSKESEEIVKMVLAVLGTLTALVLGLLIASAKHSLDRKLDELRSVSAWIVQLDRALAQYGSEAHELRNLLQQIVASRIHEFRQGFSENDLQATLSRARGIETIQNQLLNLTPQNDAQRWFKATALDISNHIAETRWMGIFNADRTIQIPFLFVLTFWLAAELELHDTRFFAPRWWTFFLVQANGSAVSLYALMKASMCSCNCSTAVKEAPFSD